MADGGEVAALLDVARRALARWELGDARLALVSTRENFVYRVDGPAGERYALRIHRPGYHTLEQLESENDWTIALHDAGIATPRPVPTSDGAWYATLPVDGGRGERHVGLIEWVEGTQLDEVLAGGERDPVALAHDLGVLAARLHAHATAWPLPPRFTRHTLDADGLVGEEPWWGPFWNVPELSAAEARRFDDARRAIHRALVAYGTDPSGFGLIHADLLPQNVLVGEHGLTVIDFDDAAFGWHLHDLSVALVQHVHHERFAAIGDALIAGYRTVRPLDDAAVALLPMFLLARTFAEIGWYDTRLAGHVSQRGSAAVTRADAIPWRIRSALEQLETVGPTLV